MAIVKEAETENGMNGLQCPVSDTVGAGRESRQDADGLPPPPPPLVLHRG